MTFVSKNPITENNDREKNTVDQANSCSFEISCVEYKDAGNKYI
jgi:hypothetical protein